MIGKALTARRVSSPLTGPAALPIKRRQYGRDMALDVAPASCLLRSTTRRASMADEVAVEARYQIEIRDLEYQRCDGEPMLARLYRALGPGPFPALVEVHGGAWATGDRFNNAPLDEALAKSGIVVLAIDF